MPSIAGPSEVHAEGRADTREGIDHEAYERAIAQADDVTPWLTLARHIEVRSPSTQVGTASLASPYRLS